MEEAGKVDFIEAFKKRTKQFVIDNIKLFQNLPKSEEARIIGRQLMRSSSSVGANYRAACRARSKAEFHAKLSIVVEEADESLFWMEILIDASIVSAQEIEPLRKEATEILKVVASARKKVSPVKSRG
ncbi:MAG TPA: four helix bundle protein [Pelobium sp.]|nr:four helix bundle protein [Pelobium sp.]